MQGKTNRVTYGWAAIVAIGGFLFGFDAIVISGVIGFITPEFDLSDWQIGLVVAAPTMMGIPAALTVSTLADITGRKKILLLLAFLYAISAVWSAFATDFYTLVLARAIGGYAFGSLGLAPIYISEISPSEKRGRMVSFNQFNIVIGFALAYFSNYAILLLSQSDLAWVHLIALDDMPWRYMLAIEALPAIIWILALSKVPESPRWLALHGQVDEARAVFRRFLSEVEIETALKEIAKHSEAATAPILSRIKEVFHPRLRFVLGIGIMLAIAQQITGINAVYFYAPSIFEQSGVGTDAAFAQAIYIGITNVIFTILAMYLIDRLGRRPLLLIGATGIVLSMAIIAYGFFQATYSLPSETATALTEEFNAPAIKVLEGQIFTNDVAFKDAVKDIIGESAFKAKEAGIMQASTSLNPTLVLFGILGFVASFAMSLGPVMWVMLPEIFPNAIRGFAMAAVGFINTIVSFLVQFLFPLLLNNFGSMGTFATFSAFGVVFLVLFIKFLPETKGKTLEELEDVLLNGRAG